MVNLVIDDKPVTIGKDATILEAAEANGIRIPTLCSLKGLDAKASCRMCIVEVAGMKTFAPACATKVAAGMVVQTSSPRVRKSRKTTLELLLARHAVDCHHCLRIGNSFCADLDPAFCEVCFFCDCVRDGFCELQALAREYGVDALPYELEPARFAVDESAGTVIRNPNKCINCRRCVDTCAGVQTVGALGVVDRGAQILVVPAAKNLKKSACVQCGRCIDNCPTGAIAAREKIDEVIYHAHRYDITAVAQVSADIAPRLAQLAGIAPAELDLRTVAAGLRKFGVEYVVLEDSAQAQALLDAQKRIASAVAAGKTALVTSSHSAGKFVGDNFPDLARQLIRCDSAQQKFGALVKNGWAKANTVESAGIRTISVAQTHANAIEAEETGCVDYVIDANELYRIFVRTGVNLKKIPPSDFDRLEDAPAVDDGVRALLTPDAWETAGKPHEVAVPVNGKKVKALKCVNLGQARAALDLVAKKATDAAVVCLFA